MLNRLSLLLPTALLLSTLPLHADPAAAPTLEQVASLTISNAFLVQISPDGKYVAASGAEDNTVHIAALGAKDSSSPVEVAKLEFVSGDKNTVNSIAFSADGSRLLTGSSSGVVRIFDMAGLKILRELNVGSAVANAWFSADGKRAITYRLDQTVQIWDADTGAQVYGKSGIYEPWYIVTGRRCATGGECIAFPVEELNYVVDLSSGKELSVEFNGSGYRMLGDTQKTPNLIALQSAAAANAFDFEHYFDDKFSLYDLVTNRTIFSTITDAPGKSANYFYSMLPSQDQKYVAGDSVSNRLQIFDVATQEEIARFQVGSFNTAKVFSPNDRYLLVSGGNSATVELLDVQTKKELAAVAIGETSLDQLFTPDSETALVDSYDGTVHVLKTSDGTDTEVKTPSSVIATHLLAEGSAALAVSYKGTLTSFSLASPSSPVAVETGLQISREHFLTTPAGSFIALSGDKGIQVYEVKSNKEETLQ